MKTLVTACFLLLPALANAEPGLVIWSETGQFTVRSAQLGLPGVEFYPDDDRMTPSLWRVGAEDCDKRAVHVDGSTILVQAPADGVWILTYPTVGRNTEIHGIVETEYIFLISNAQGSSSEELLAAMRCYRRAEFSEASAKFESESKNRDDDNSKGLLILSQNLSELEPEAAHLRDADALLSAGRLNEARLAYRELRTRERRSEWFNADSCAGEGKALLLLSRFDEAIPLLAASLEREPAPDTALDLTIAQYRRMNWEEAWLACVVCLKFSDKGSRLQERAAELGVAIAAQLDTRKERLAAWREIVKWAGETEGGKAAAKELK